MFPAVSQWDFHWLGHDTVDMYMCVINYRIIICVVYGKITLYSNMTIIPYLDTCPYPLVKQTEV